MRCNFATVILTSFSLTVLVACASINVSTEHKEIPQSHVWSYLRSYGGEPLGYATYSYVLAGRDQTDALHTRRYSALVAAIQSSTADADRDRLPIGAQRSFMNLFLIPAAKNKNIDKPDTKLSMLLVTTLTASDKRFLNPGPFIVTLHHPISFVSSPHVTMLFVDLTSVHPEAMREIVTVYKSRLSDSPLQGIERLRSLKLAVLNTLLIAEDRISFARAAHADLEKAFTSK